MGPSLSPSWNFLERLEPLDDSENAWEGAFSCLVLYPKTKGITH